MQNVKSHTETRMELIHWAMEPVDWQTSDSSEQRGFEKSSHCWISLFLCESVSLLDLQKNGPNKMLSQIFLPWNYFISKVGRGILLVNMWYGLCNMHLQAVWWFSGWKTSQINLSLCELVYQYQTYIKNN